MEQRSRGIAALIRPIVFNCNNSASRRQMVRTTLAIDEDLLGVATSMAVARGVSIGHAVSELMRLGVESGGGLRAEGGTPSDGSRARESR